MRWLLEDLDYEYKDDLPIKELFSYLADLIDEEG